MTFEFKPIGVLHSCFKQRFGIPSQARLATAARGWIEFYPPYDREEAFVGLEDFSHVWLMFQFHQSLANDVSFTVQPPQKDGARFGLWATRAPNRPNQIGQSLVELERIEKTRAKVKLHLKGIDLVEGTPIIDIKPYLPYVDAIADAKGGFAHQAPQPRLRVDFTDNAAQQLAAIEDNYSDLRQLIIEVLQYDPRPIYYRKRSNKKIFVMELYDLLLRFEIL
ncbi:MAG TPA: tRNA (N6-threonylcarbamoyladenosine(37)-N6)-methyltransferase TrmO, partial [Candidatus Tenderia electrophaga]|nr:tRNA (N6-threonylcarbamoyladenosine(37)-N6)-methyltransferase TrmO [Candidatus Tenderia electrophaga]